MKETLGKRRLWWIGKTGSLVLTTGLGVLLVAFPFTRTLESWSRDLPFAFRGYQADDRIAIVDIDPESARELLPPGSPPETPLDRRVYARLLRLLKEQGARLVFLDVVFRADKPTEDAELAEAIRSHGRVVLAARVDRTASNLGASGTSAIAWRVMPNETLTAAAAGVGLANVPKDERCGIAFVRDLPMPESEMEPAMAVAAGLLGVGHPMAAHGPGHAINFRGPPGHFEHRGLAQVLASGHGFASNRIVLVGARPRQGFHDGDWFGTPYQRFGHGRMPGVELQANVLSNLLDGDPLCLLALRWQVLLAVLAGTAYAAATMGLRPVGGALAVAGVSSMVVAGSWLGQWQAHHWWTWLVPVAIQGPVAYGWALGFKYLVLERHGRRLRGAFAAYLSPVMADRIAESRFSLELGGEEVEASVMFTDLEGFTAMSESLAPKEVSRLLVAYFDETTGAILREDGTIVKYIGDAVMAVWGAPLPDPRHAERAVQAAWEMHRAGEKEIEGRRFRTRIGIGTGRVLSGNLGSRYRFDYTCIGDTTNFAARLEGMNKRFGTSVLLSDATVRQLPAGRFHLRPLGSFVAVGKREARAIHELLGPADSGPLPEWVAAFVAALGAFGERDWDRAGAGFRGVIAARGGADGPSAFYLGLLDGMQSTPPPQGWKGEVHLTEK